MKKNIVVVGLGYVGLSNAILLSQKNNVVGIDIAQWKIDKLNNKISPIADTLISKYLIEKRLNFKARTEDGEAIKSADFIIISTPTNYEEAKGFFETSSIENVINQVVNLQSSAVVVIKSTIPIGYMREIVRRFPQIPFLFSPEFLREGRALYDNLYPSRIIVGTNKNDLMLLDKAKEFAELLKEGAEKADVPILLMEYTEAESVKLFANTYLAMRVAYFNELDNFAIEEGLDTKNIIDGICTDPRIGSDYNNPSFGYGGYCFPKDTKQLYANYKFMAIPNSLIKATVESNDTRKQFLANYIIKHTDKQARIGIYRLVMKSNSDNCRSSAIFDIIKIVSRERKVLVYEPTCFVGELDNVELVNDLEILKKESDLIVANRFEKELEDVKHKIFTRDIFNRD